MGMLGQVWGMKGARSVAGEEDQAGETEVEILVLPWE